MLEFIERARELLNDQKDEFQRSYVYAYQVVAELAYDAITDETGDALVAQRLFKRVSDAPYATVYRRYACGLTPSERSAR